jgi:hypothetical protein
VKGPIIGDGGLRYRIACDQSRAYLATVTNLEAATDNPKIVNCPGCRKEAIKQKLNNPTGSQLVMQE